MKFWSIAKSFVHKNVRQNMTAFGDYRWYRKKSTSVEFFYIIACSKVMSSNVRHKLSKNLGANGWLEHHWFICKSTKRTHLWFSYSSIVLCPSKGDISASDIWLRGLFLVYYVSRSHTLSLLFQLLFYSLYFSASFAETC